MKVVFISDCLTTQMAGIHYYARQFIERVISQYPQHEYYHITSSEYPVHRSQNIIIPILRSIPFHYRIRYISSIPKRIKDLDPDIVIEMAHFGPFFLPKSIKSYVVVHDLTPILYPQYHDWISVLWHRLFFGNLLQKVDGIITNSKTTKNDVGNHFGIRLNKITVAYPNPSYLFRGETITEENSGEKDNANTFKLITVGTIEPRKNHLFILRALEKVSSITFEWAIVGKKGWKNKDFLTAFQGSKIKSNVHIWGYLDDLKLVEIYQSSQILIYASIYEGFGLPILEAMRYGLALILSDTDVHREVAGDAAVYFKNQEELIDLLNDLSQEQVASLSHKSQHKYEEWNQAQLNLPFLSI